MLIIQEGSWNNTHTDISKFLVSRFAQLLDRKDSISHYHRSTNGLILLQELYSTSRIVLKRWKNSFRLQSLINEANDNKLPYSIKTDKIIIKYFRIVSNEINKWSKASLDPKLVLEINQKSLAYLATVKPKYFSYLKSELKSLDLKSNHFARITETIDSLLNSLISQLVYEGYSLSYLRSIPQKLSASDLNSLIDNLFSYFPSEKDKEYVYVFPGDQKLISNALLDHMHHSIYKKKELEKDEAESKETIIKVFQSLSENKTFNSAVDQLINSDSLLIHFKGKDPFSSFGNSITNAYRKYSIEEHGGSSNNILNEFFENPHYYNKFNGEIERLKFEGADDPLILSSRTNTLSLSLAKHESILDSLSKESLFLFEEAIYFYNLARMVPAVENSYILLWTALESLMGLRNEKSDIDIIKSNVAKSLALGSVGRRITSLLERINKTSIINGWNYCTLDCSLFTSEGLSEGLIWAIDQTELKTEKDPYNTLKQDPLLSSNYISINTKWKTNKDLLAIIESSFKMTTYQLDRLYSARNLIIHSAKFGDTDSNLWLHLEWYVGKLLAQSVALVNEYHYDDIIDKDPRDIVFGCLQGQYDSTLAYLKAHENEDINYEHLLNSNIFRFPILCF